MMPIQFILTVLMGLAILRVLAGVRANQVSWQRSLLWLALWTLGIAVVWFPDATTVLAHLTGVKRGVDVVLYLSVVLLGYAVFRLYATVEKQDQLLTRLVSELSLERGPLSTPPSPPPTVGGAE